MGRVYGMIWTRFEVYDGDTHPNPSPNPNCDLISGTMGICPQHDVLYPTLTVEEQLSLFAVLKGVRPDEVELAVKQKIKEVALTKKQKT